MSSTELRQSFISKYRIAWDKLKFMLSHGSNSMTSDDHEYYNDYPETPLIPWGMLSTDSAYRRDWARNAKKHFEAIQQPKAIEEIKIGNDLSIFIADTRANREKNDLRFMKASDFEKMINWVKKLRQPGVLVLGQPIFTSNVGQVKFAGIKLTSDRNLPYYGQYWTLLRTLAEAKHDIVVLAGDVHFGRISKWHASKDDRGKDVYVHEVVSSPMKVLKGAESAFEIPRGQQVWPSAAEAKLFNFPAGKKIEYKKVVPSEDGKSANHFMTLSFTKDPRGAGVNVKVRVWLTDVSAAANIPARAWTYSMDLDIGRPGPNTWLEPSVYMMMS